jgi:hypothetical protein
MSKTPSKEWQNFMSMEPFYNEELNSFTSGVTVKLTYRYEYDDGDPGYPKPNISSHALSLHYHLHQTKSESLSMKNLLELFAGRFVSDLTSIQSSQVLYTDLVIESDKPLIKDISRLKFSIYEGGGHIDGSSEEGRPMGHLDPFVIELQLSQEKTYRFLLYGTPRSLQRFDSEAGRAVGLPDKLLALRAALFSPSKWGNISITPVREKAQTTDEGLAGKVILPVMGARFKRKLS